MERPLPLEPATTEDVNQAIKYFQEAIKLDPQYALAYAGLADCYVLGNILQMPPREAMPMAAEAARKALAIDDQLAEAHTSLAKIKLSYEWDWAGAETEFKQAIQLNPGYATAHQWYGVYLSEMGRHEESVHERRPRRSWIRFRSQLRQVLHAPCTGPGDTTSPSRVCRQ